MALLVWAFALASGMANACVLEAFVAQAHTGVSHASDAHHAHAGDALGGDGDVVAADHDNEEIAPKDSCLKDFNDVSIAQITPQAGIALTDPGQAPFVVFVWNAATPVSSAPSRFDDLQALIAGLTL